MHGALRAVALSRLKRDRREAFEARAADILVQLGEREAAVLALHRAAAGQPVAQTYLAAAERALRLGDLTTSAELADDGLAAAGSSRGPFQALLLTIHERIALTNADWDLGTQALAILETQALTKQAQFDLTARRFRLALRSGRVSDARAVARRAHELAKQPGLTEGTQARAHLYRGEMAERRGELQTAQKLFTAAHRGLESRGEPDVDLARALAGMARSALLGGEYATAENRFRTALTHARSQNWVDLAVEAQTGLVQVTRQTADLRRARGYASDLERIDLTNNRGRRILLIRGLLAAETRRWGDAQTHWVRALSEPADPDGHLGVEVLVHLARLFRYPAEATDGLDRQKVQLAQTAADLAAAAEMVEARWPLWSPALKLAQATLAAALGEPCTAWIASVAAAFKTEGLMMGEERADTAYGLARLSMQNDRHTEASLGYLRKAVEYIDAAVVRMGGPERPRYLGRPSVSIIVSEA
ncbi:MAG: hypothetical protein AAFV29_15515, partial [Myxococcota bacterium]